MDEFIVKPLMRREFHLNIKVFLIIIGILTLYIAMITAMFDPSIGKTLSAFEKSMPQVMSAFGMSSSGTTLLAFMKTYLYGFLLLFLPMVFDLVVAARLTVAYVDKGSMSWILSGPCSRSAVMWTQSIVLCSSVAAMVVYTFFVELICGQVMFPGNLDVPMLFLLNIGLFAFHYFFSGLFFFLSCEANEARHAMGIGAGVFTGFYLIQMLANISDKASFLKYLTIFSLFDPQGLIEGSTLACIKMLILIVAGHGFFDLGRRRFEVRDLPI